jgi:phosphoglycerate dehydrogenase-like enzyme
VSPVRTPVRVCAFHPTMGPDIAAAVARSGLPATVRVVSDTTADPPDRDGIDVLVANRFPAGLLGRCERLRWLHLTGTGVDHVPAGRPRPDLVVTTSAAVPAVPVAEFAWMGLLALAKDAPALVRRQRERAWVLPDARRVAGSRLLLVGLGRIGTEIARRAAAFDVRVTAVTRTAAPSALVERVLPPDRLVEAAAEADHLVLAAPATAGSSGLVGERVLAALPPTATVVNVGRSAVLDTAALVAALVAGRLRGALLDVHDAEPLPPDSPLWTVPNLWLTPHGAYRFPAEGDEVGRLVAANLAAFLAGRPLPDAARLPVVAS